MKLFAQHGASEGEKITEGLAQGLLDGVIYSPRDVSLASLKDKLSTVGKASPTAERLVDPQYYAIFVTALRKPGWATCWKRITVPYFQPRRRGQLERESQIEKELDGGPELPGQPERYRNHRSEHPVPKTLNSIEAVISKNFIRLTKPKYAALTTSGPFMRPWPCPEMR